MPTDLYAELIYLISTDSQKKKRKEKKFSSHFL